MLLLFVRNYAHQPQVELIRSGMISLSLCERLTPSLQAYFCCHAEFPVRTSPVEGLLTFLSGQRFGYPNGQSSTADKLGLSPEGIFLHSKMTVPETVLSRRIFGSPARWPAWKQESWFSERLIFTGSLAGCYSHRADVILIETVWVANLAF